MVWPRHIPRHEKYNTLLHYAAIRGHILTFIQMHRSLQENDLICSMTSLNTFLVSLTC